MLSIRRNSIKKRKSLKNRRRNKRIKRFSKKFGAISNQDEIFNILKSIPLDNVLIDDILKEDMGIDNNDIKSGIKSKITPESISILIDNIKQIKVPQYREFVNEFIKISPIEKLSSEIIRCVHHTLLLDIIVQMMVDNPDFKDLIINEMYTKRRSFGLPEKGTSLAIKLIRKLGAFRTMKMLSVDASFRYMSNAIDKVCVPKRMLPKKFDAITINIKEAVYFEKNKDNNILGRKIAKNPPTDFIVECKEVKSKSKSKSEAQKWMDDYLAWNMVFIIGNQEDLDLLFPKLIIPSVSLVDPELFMFRRVYALWLSINFCLFRKLSRKEPKPITKLQKKLAKIFASINKNTT